jgi:hypothetical protein
MVGAIGRIRRRRRRLHRTPYAPRRARPACDRPRRQRTSGRVRIKGYQPIDRADRIDNWLYLPEVLYAFMLIIFVSAGAGPYSLDAAILRLGVQ